MSEKDQPTTSNKKDEDSQIEIPSVLDITSEDFNPQEALYSSTLRKPEKISIKQYSNVSEFESALKRVGVLAVGKKQKPGKQVETKYGELKTAETQTKSIASSASVSTRRFEEHQMPVIGKLRTRHTRNLIKKMDEYKDGPLSILHDSWKSQKKIIVYVRKQHGVRGYILGYVLAFDKHINLLLQNCYEIWKRRKFDFSSNNATLGTAKNCSKRLEKLGINIPETQVKSVNRKYVMIKRKIDQVLIRGEQVCLLRIANSNDEEKLNKFIL